MGGGGGKDRVVPETKAGGVTVRDIVYMACTADRLELPVVQTDTRREMSVALGVSRSFLCLMLNGIRGQSKNNKYRVPLRLFAVDLDGVEE